ncbi:MAG TPA: tetratricopeptide repeat protein [Gaiellaceae bacterium]|jgi:predicted ATPase|nr:tetratricopeptide repeat protein [Gaiellaceae bacterium]
MGRVSVTLLGGFAASVDGRPVPESAWRLKKARELVKLLALAPHHRLHREQAMDVLWRDREPAAAANNLHQAVFVARRALGGAVIEVRDEVLSLTADVDVDRFETAAAAARHANTGAAYRAALALYRGELLPENRYDDWADGRREEAARLAAELAEALTAVGAGRAFGLPAEASSFVGRRRELAQLGSLLSRTRLLTLAGTGGAGKTRLALELGRTVESGFADGAALVELAPLADGQLVADAVAGTLDVRPLDHQEVLDAAADFLAGRTLLLVVDNCEHVLSEAAAVVDRLLRAAPGLTVLATSREPLRVAGEVVFRVPSLDLPDPEQALAPDELLEYEAVSLFVDRGAAAAPGFELDGDNAVHVARICHRLDGLPLALELAAGRLGALTPEAIAERLDDRFRLLRTGSLAAPTRQQTLAATLQWSHDLLEPHELVLFRRLGVFAGGFDLDAVEAVCAGDADTLARLTEKSLVTVDDSRGRRRYRLLETVRLYARERLHEAGEREAVEERHARWALDLAEARRGSAALDAEIPNLRVAYGTLLSLAPADALRLCVALLPLWLRRIELDEARRRFARALEAADDRTSLGVEALLAAAAIEFRSGALADGAVLAERSRSLAAEIGDTAREWRALEFLGEFGVAGDAMTLAVDWLEQALELARRERFAAAEALTIHSLGVSAWISGDFEYAAVLIERAVAALLELADTDETVPSPLNIAEIRREDADGRPGVRHLFEDTLQPFVDVSCAAAASYALANLAAIARMRGDLARAWALLDESEARFAAAGDDVGRAAVLVRRAYTALAAGDTDAARSHLEQALELRGRLADRRGHGLVLSGLGLVDTTAGELDAAERHLGEARELFRRAGDRWGLASSLWRTADVAFARGDVDAAETALIEARAILEETQRGRWIASTIVALADVARLRGDEDQARELLLEARGHYAAHDDPDGVEAVDRILAKQPLRPPKEAGRTTRRNVESKGSRR